MIKPEKQSAFAGPIVALGASAGGLDALDRFFASLAPMDNTAFVVIQHLAPEHKTMMDTLLARHTRMRVMVATDELQLEGGHVYVIPPGATMTISGGFLRLVPRPATGITLPINAFFNSLTLEAPERAIGIILSGTGSDGTQGALALNAAGAWVLAQDPETARFDGMPRNVIATGVVDHVLSPEGLAVEVASIVTKSEIRPKSLVGSEHLREEVSLKSVLQLFSGIMQIDFSQYKPNTLLRRLERRMNATGMVNLQGYADFLSAHAEEIEALRHELLIPVTRFFRDPEAFEALSALALENLIAGRQQQSNEPIRVWVPACSTGEEAYSIAIMLLDLMAEYRCDILMKFFATDVEPAYLERAGAGRYAEAQFENMPVEMRNRWFTATGVGYWQVRPELRQRIVFSRHDVLADAPFTQLDLISCRNMLIYLQPSAQDRVIRRLSYALKVGGTLFLGTSENPSASDNDYLPLDTRQKIYRLQHRVTTLPPDDLLMGFNFSGRTRHAKNVYRTDQTATRSVLFRSLESLVRHYAPPAMLINAERELIHLFGDIQKFLRFRPGDASLDILHLLPQNLAPVVVTLLHSAVREKQPQKSRPVQIQTNDHTNGVQELHVTIWPLDTDAVRIEYLLVCFETPAVVPTEKLRVLEDIDLSSISSRQVEDLERELVLTRTNLQDTIQELGTTNEELQAANEELMAANEELQSTNEELQSVNEELHTINAEYQLKISELNEANADLESLTRAAQIPLIFLDAELRLTRYTPQATQLFRFRESDIGRPITDFNHGLVYPELFSEISAALEDPSPRQREVRDESGGNWLVTILSFANHQRELTRLVISCIDVSSLRDIKRLQSVLDALPAHIAVLDQNGTIQIINQSWRVFAESNDDHVLIQSGVGINYLDICRTCDMGDEYKHALLNGLSAVLERQQPHFMILYPCHTPEQQRWFLMHAVALSEGGCVVAYFNLTGWIDPACVLSFR